jgi:hypothetical protein
MPYTLDDFYREWVERTKQEILENMTPEQLNERVSTEDLERLLQQRRAAEASEAKPKKSGTPGRGSPKRKAK